ncbi:MAG: hypothetical protein U1D36_21750 [Hydrogenophaga sp.]|uniref:transposase n=1 Tax=Hydrogenophaga sp. TaxID=1904254 RepID=UPI002ABCA19B|nr:transposase [Hydrogenophaga sp.]MDZ4177084.1 hypothetical protein [Hydrogenophaga sp.]
MDDADRRALLDVLGSGLDRFDASALAWCLMGNHYHCVIQTRLANLSLLMRHINGVFTQRFNQRATTRWGICFRAVQGGWATGSGLAFAPKHAICLSLLMRQRSTRVQR